MFVDWKTTISGLVTGAALGYAGYASGNPELILAGAAAATGGLLSKDSKLKSKKSKPVEKKKVIKKKVTK